MQLEKMSELKDTSEKSYPSASSQSISDKGSMDDQSLAVATLPTGDLPEVERPLPYFKLA